MTGTSVARRGRPRDARCDAAIVRATLELLVEGGAPNVSIDGVAARAGVGKATIYRRWNSKEALLLDAINSEASVIPTPDTGNLRGDLEEYFDGLIERMTTGHGSDVVPHLIEAACYDPEVRSSLDAFLRGRLEPLRAVLKRAKSRGELPGRIDVAVLVDVLIGSAIYRQLLTAAPVDRVFVRKLLDIVLRVPDVRAAPSR